MSSVAGARESIPERTYRSTVEGRRLEYQLTVIQQPERARACGSGAKSSADRRPVDPPPVVELRIFEYNGTEKKDITFSYSANFFLYATLEHARPIAHGRMPGTQQPPVLTGMPVSGMAYLDRPQEAGYFIFPDLSVRHEGKYRLSFNLYEETKDPKDHDAEPVANDKGLAGLASPNGSFDWRLEVKSVPFDVFSAKKFPGLAESTVLSRTVAEQGCRVRIRRDVRMRRRDGNKDHENYEDDEYNRLRRSASPADSVHEGYTRHRSLSQEPKRPAIEQHQQYPQGYGPSQAPPPMPAPQFAPPSHYPIQHATYPPAPMPPQQPRYAQPPPPPAAPASQPYYQADYNRGAQAPSDPYGRDLARAQYEAQMREKEMQDKGAYEDYQRRSSVNYGAPAPAPQYPSYSRNTSISYPPPPQQQYPPRTQTPVSQPPVNLAPLKMPAIEPKYESLSSPAGPLSGGSRSIPPQLPSPATYQDRPGYSNYSGSAPTSAVPDATRNGKRPYDAVFSGSASSYSQPLRNGMRPTSLDMTAANFDDDDDAVDMEALKMQYKRADGNIFSRELPTLQ